MVIYPSDFIGPLKPEDKRSYVPSNLMDKYGVTVEESGSLSGGTRTSTGGTSRRASPYQSESERLRVIAQQQAATAEAARVEATRQEAIRQEAARVAQERAARNAAEIKRNQLAATRNARVQELARQNVESGISTGGSAEANARRVIQTRDAAEIASAEKEARVGVGATGTVTKAPKKTITQRIKSAPREILKATQTLIQGTSLGKLAKKVSGTVLPVGVFSLGVPGGPGGEVPITSITKGLREGGLGVAGQVVEPLIPETVGELAVTTVALKALVAAPPIVRIGLDVAFTPGEIKATLDPTQDPATRIRSGIFATLGVAGTAFEGAPFIKGAATRFTPGFRGVNVDEAVDASRLFPGGKADVIRNIGGGDEAFDIRLIDEGIASFPISEQKAFTGKKITATTSARDLLGGTDNVLIESREVGDLGLFLTPTLKPLGDVSDVGEARVSRLGLKDLFKPSGADASISFRNEQPQIVTFRDIDVTTTGRGGTARALGFPSPELEVTFLPGTEITGSKVGTTIIRGQKVELFDAMVVGGGDITQLPKVNIPGLSSRATGATVSPASLSLAFRGSTSTTTSTSTTVSVVSSIPSLPPSILSSPPSRPSSFSGGGSSPPSITSKLPSVPSLPPSLPSLPPSIPSSPPSRPSRPFGRPSRPLTSPPRIRTPHFPILKAPTIKQGRTYGVQIRRGGQFFNVGTFRTQREALLRGAKLTSSTLAATFKVTGVGRLPKAIKGFRTKKGKSGSTLFIEKRSLRLQPLKLSSGGEVREIQKIKSKKKSKSRRKKK